MLFVVVVVVVVVADVVAGVAVVVVCCLLFCRYCLSPVADITIAADINMFLGYIMFLLHVGVLLLRLLF